MGRFWVVLAAGFCAAVFLAGCEGCRHPTTEEIDSITNKQEALKILGKPFRIYKLEDVIPEDREKFHRVWGKEAVEVREWVPWFASKRVAFSFDEKGKVVRGPEVGPGPAPDEVIRAKSGEKF